MKLLNVGTARSIWLLNTEDLNPHGLDLVPVLISLQARYKFQKSPTKIEEVYPTTGGIQFANGSFKFEDRQIAVPAFTIYNDGIVAETRHSTKATDAFVHDALLFMNQHHGLEFRPDMLRSTGYLSELVVTTDANLESLTDKLASFAALLSSDASLKFKPSGIRFGTDPAQPGTPLQFAFERKAGIGFEQNRYFSQAPFDTEHHVSLLEILERIVNE